MTPPRLTPALTPHGRLLLVADDEAPELDPALARRLLRRGMVLAFRTRVKQICNHPSHWTGDGAWDERDSGKLARLRELAEVIGAKQEKVLVFTQSREVTAPLAAFLADVFGRAGLVLHGGTPVKARRELVQRFQEDEGASTCRSTSGSSPTPTSRRCSASRWPPVPRARRRRTWPRRARKWHAGRPRSRPADVRERRGA